MFGLGAGEILVIGVLALIFIGPKKLPELARGLGKGLREFQKAKDDLLEDKIQSPAAKLDAPTDENDNAKADIEVVADHQAEPSDKKPKA